MHFPKNRVLIIAALVLLAVLAGCQSAAQPTPESSTQIDLRVDPAEPAVGKATLVVTVTDTAGKPINDAKVSVRGSMNHAGMVPVLGDTDKADNGEYTIPFEWTMGGDWFVDVTVTLADGSTAMKSFDYTVSSTADMSGMDMESTPEATMDMGGMDMESTPEATMDMGNMDMTEEPGG